MKKLGFGWVFLRVWKWEFGNVYFKVKIEYEEDSSGGILKIIL